MSTDTLFEGFERPAEKDFKVNFKKFFESEALDPRYAGLITLACADMARSEALRQFSMHFLEEQKVPDGEIQEARDIAAAMATANLYYRFRHFVQKEAYRRPAGFRMQVLTKPVMGPLPAELIALAVSVINGCEICVQGHEKSCLAHGASEDLVHDVARLASAVHGLSVLLRQREN